MFPPSDAHLSINISIRGHWWGGDLGPTEARSFFWKGDFRDDLGLWLHPPRYSYFLLLRVIYAPRVDPRGHWWGDNIPASWKMRYYAAFLPFKHLLTTLPYVQTCGSLSSFFVLKIYCLTFHMVRNAPSAPTLGSKWHPKESPHTPQIGPGGHW